MSACDLARPEIRELHAYEACSIPGDFIRLNANEAASAVGAGNGLNRYPSARPAALTAALSALYGVGERQVLAVRGSSEGIDLLIRAFCTAGRDNILVTPPVFELYQIYADVQGAGTLRVPLAADRDFDADVDAILAACNERTKLVFLCSPNNPVGTVIPRDKILRILEARAGRSLVVVDEAYVEYSDAGSLASLIDDYDNLVVLRTLSKAHALAGARCGAVIAAPGIVRLLDGVLAPYALSSPVIASVLAALQPARLSAATALATRTVAERERVRAALRTIPAVERTWPSQANFLLVRLRDLAAAGKRLAGDGIAIRSFDGVETLRDCARITIAAPEENDRLLATLRSLG